MRKQAMVYHKPWCITYLYAVCIALFAEGSRTCRTCVEHVLNMQNMCSTSTFDLGLIAISSFLYRKLCSTTYQGIPWKNLDCGLDHGLGFSH